MSTTTKLKPIPVFTSAREEADFWLNQDSTEYVDYTKSERWQMPNLKLSSKPITLRMPESLVNKIKLQANKRGIAYQALIKDTLYRAFE